MAAFWANALTAVLLVVASAMTFIALRAWFETRSHKVAALAAGFGVMALKGAFFSMGLFAEPDWERVYFVPGLFFDVVALALFYVGVFRRSVA